MRIFAASDYYRQFMHPLSESGSHVFAGRAEIKRFPNGEMHAVVHDDVRGQECLIIGTIAPPDGQLLAVLMLAEALKRNGAASVRAFLPYLGYARQDKFSKGESGGIALIGALLRASGIDEAITIDAHSERDRELIGMPLHSLSPAPLFAAAILRFGWTKPTIIAPDEGALHRARALAKVWGAETHVSYLVKRRADGVVHDTVVGEAGDKVVLVDDILDTGRSLISACKTLRKKGVQEVVIAVTHGLFTNDDWKQLFDLGVQILLVSESCREAVLQNHPKIQLVSLAPLLPGLVAGRAAKEAQYERALA